jgi:hypothetical protein
MAYKVGSVAKRVGRSPTWIRKNTAAFAEFFSDTANPPQGKTRVYNDRDLQVLLTIDERRNLEKSDDEIRADLVADLIVDLPPTALETPQKGRKDKSPVAITEREIQLSRAHAEVKGKLDIVENELDYFKVQLAERDETIGELRERAAAAEAVLERIDQQAVISVVHSQATQQGVDSIERGRPWWKFWGN